ncbi:16S rRNA (guanine(1516)-N(2))-methyltransferase [hydrothermal vent metagenome]|uniref:16S rRNA (Guanine(1516)-N(2))-methyltransferase n=1 Tax=hydrothermal vent metagenome TaxID=652676 RepID=A0A3B0WBF3_9ZZZZ
MSDATSTPIAIQVSPFGDAAQALKEAQQLSQTLQLPLITDMPKEEHPKIRLGWHQTQKDPTPKLALFQPDSGAVFIDFTQGKKAHRRQFGGGKGQPLVRAMGKLENRLPRIIDATAGMGGDSFVLASLGFEVLMLERSLAVSALLEDALLRGRKHAESDIELLNGLNRLQVMHTDSATFLQTQTSLKPEVEVVYMDPMYPEKKKKAATKKEMKILQNLVGPDKDSQILLQAALNTACYRVVVKRPKNAPIILLSNPNLVPTSQITSPNTRYDVYSMKALSSKIRL